MKKIKLYFTLVTLFALSKSYSQNLKEKVIQCQNEKVIEQGLAESIPFAKFGKARCNSPELRNLKCETDDEDIVVEYEAPDGYQIYGEVGFIKTSASRRSTTSGLKKFSRKAVITLSCRGNHCDKGQREWIEGNLVGTIKRIPTQDELSKITLQCLDDLGL